MNWEDVLKRDDIVGGDIETHEDGCVFRGPIESIELRGGIVFFESPWTARMPERSDPDFGKWKKWDITSCRINSDIKPTDIGQGRIQFNMPMLGMGIIFPKGGSKLDPSKVEGLAIS